MMKHVFTSVVVLSAIFTTTVTAQTPIDTVAIPTDGSTAFSSVALIIGASYRIEVSGTFTMGGPGDGMADAEYADFSNPPSSVQDAPTGFDLGVQLDGVKPDWGPFASDHVYNFILTGDGTTLGFSYADNFYSDNSGDLNGNVYLIPEPTTAAMLALLALPLGLRRRR